jgi:nucleotide-binding universal stress UspA family protein
MSQAPTTGVGVGADTAGRSSVIVVGYSSKPEGRAALRRAIEEAQVRKSELVIVHTSPEPELAGLRDELTATGIPYRITGSADVQDPAEELINAAESAGADFIVIGLRRRSPVGKRLLGSNAQRVLLDASCPVLAVKAELDG